ncbi:hypothetical protein SAMN05661091_1182 [Paenibacillus uliginis N3/975]|uniref:Uncharacterized protein n=1 Tax=Paenibacillus uliginis N3/975 TaxID=1313296 RepID=A0A1X7GVD4_9BACL|nr:hypothetical protein SAMN05661091_1182 [Paenibacillus uliginis N3/975]
MKKFGRTKFERFADIITLVSDVLFYIPRLIIKIFN